jgi:hypothetical protein
MEPCERPDDFWAHNYAAAWYNLVMDAKRANAHFKLLNGYWTRWPWNDFTISPAFAFRISRISAKLLAPVWFTRTPKRPQSST